MVVMATSLLPFASKVENIDCQHVQAFLNIIA